MKITIEATPLEVSEVICALVNYGANTVGDTDGDTDDLLKDWHVSVKTNAPDIDKNRLFRVLFAGLNKTST